MTHKSLSHTELFITLAQPDQFWISRWVDVYEFVDDYSRLKIWNGLSWWRKESQLAKKYNIETQKKGHKITHIRLNGFNIEDSGTQYIRADIRKFYKSKRCAILDTSNPETDHKNGWKNDLAVMDPKTQKLEDFQALSKAANDAKRQHCKECKKTGIRFDAKRLGYPISFVQWNKQHIWDIDGCKWCFWYDPIEFRKKLKSAWD
jgi:hypothetical protein